MNCNKSTILAWVLFCFASQIGASSAFAFPDDGRDCRIGECGQIADRYSDNDHRDHDLYNRGQFDAREWSREHRPDYAPAKVQPSCPSNTTFDGKHCIVPENQRRKGDKGTINTCPNGMWLSGGSCVPN